jgi:hypothetical protein
MDNTISHSAYHSLTPFNTTASSSIPGTFDEPENHSPLYQQGDRVTLSPESVSKNPQKEEEEIYQKPTVNNVDEGSEISSAELREIQKLQQRDAEVKAHEQAHLATAGQYATGGATFSYKTGPNGRRYATGGEVPIDLSKEKDPQATLVKMTQVRRAALAPANPSAADRNIAARASMIAAEAMSELNSSAGKNADSKISPKSTQQDDSISPNKSSVASADNRTSANPGDAIPTHTRHMVLQAYTAHS